MVTAHQRYLFTEHVEMDAYTVEKMVCQNFQEPPGLHFFVELTDSLTSILFNYQEQKLMTPTNTLVWVVFGAIAD